MNLLNTWSRLSSNCSFYARFEVNESACRTLKKGISIFYNLMVFLDTSVLVFKARKFGPSSPWCSFQGLGCQMWGTNPLIFKEKHIFCYCFYFLDHCPQRWARLWICLSCQSWCAPFNFCCGIDVQLVLRLFSEEIVSFSSWFAVSMKVCEFKIFLWHHVKLLTLIFFIAKKQSIVWLYHRFLFTYLCKKIFFFLCFGNYEYIFVIRFSCEHELSRHLDKYWGAGLLDSILRLCLVW